MSSIQALVGSCAILVYLGLISAAFATAIEKRTSYALFGTLL
jgi:hypothetical protein